MALDDKCQAEIMLNLNNTILIVLLQQLLSNFEAEIIILNLATEAEMKNEVAH